MTYLVIPPGGGKTLVGLEAARQLARPMLVLCPNTAIQAQWDAAFAPPPAMAATASRDLPFGRGMNRRKCLESACRDRPTSCLRDCETDLYRARGHPAGAAVVAPVPR